VGLELITVIECVCADGMSTLLGFIFPGVDMFPEWGMVNNNIMCIKLSTYYSWLKKNLCFTGSVSTSENGWISNFLCAEWFEKSFVPHAKAHHQQISKNT